LLEQIQDIERITQRVVLRRTNPKELRALAASLVPLSELGRELRGCDREFLNGVGKQVGDFTQLFTEINDILADDPPLKLADGGVIRDGADTRVDELRDLVHGGRGWMERYQEQERQRSGIRNLKVKRTGAFGYFIEVSKASLALVPKDYERKQTLVNAERFVTAELRERERGMETAEGQLLARERELFEELCAQVAGQAGELAQAARAAAEVDVVLSLAAVAQEHGWCRPVLLDDCAADGSEGSSPKLVIEGGRHPVVEEAVGKQYYTPNDCYLDGQSQQIMLLTGPNMGGKSTYLRMVAT
jgi:DNA mismatch repair protein MutS